MQVRKDDKVVVIAGKEKGKRGKVLKVNPSTSRIVVEGVNMVKRAIKPTQKNPQGGFSEKELPIHSSNAMLLCPNCGSTVRVGRHFLADGSKVRFCKKCGADVDKG